MNTQETHRKKYSLKFWIAFWLISALLLFSWYVFLQIKNKNLANLKLLFKIAPIGSERRNELAVLADIFQKAGGFNQEQTFLILFQNNLELRPGGGFIGSFGILKTKNGKISDIQVFDTGIFDGRIPNTEIPPAPLADFAGTDFWKLRDSNWSPDFRANAEKAGYFYRLGDGRENFDGVIAVNTDILNSVLSLTGPVKIADYPGEYNDQTAILQLEYQVEKGFLEQGIQRGERKNIMKQLADILIGKIHSFSFSQDLTLAKKIEGHLKEKDIQMFFKDESLQSEVDRLGWGGKIENPSGDYLMVVDANLNSLKSDFCIRRKMDYNVDLSGEAPQAVLDITYQHTCRVKDWMTTDYRDWLRVYAPGGSFLEEANGQDGPPTNTTENINNPSSTNGNIGGGVKFSDELGKKVFGMKVFVPVGQSKTITLKYRLPESAKNNPYKLLVQKQSGSGDVPLEISVRKPDGSEVSVKEVLTGDKEFGF